MCVFVFHIQMYTISILKILALDQNSRKRNIILKNIHT